MAAPQTLRLETVTVEDVSTLTEVWFAAFSDPFMRHFWPDTPGVRKRWTETNHNDLLNKPFQHYVKVVDPQLKDAQGRARIAAYAKWDLAMTDERGGRFLPWHPDMPGQDCDAFFKKEDDERRRVMGNQKHYYLDTVATHPDYQRRGAGSMLVRYGCELADKDGVSAYVDATKDGAPLYQRFGFEDKSEPDAGNIASMVRPRRNQFQMTE